MEKVYSWYCYSNINGLPNKSTNIHTHTRVLRLTVERIPFFLFHNLTNQKKITNKYVCFVTAFRSNFTSLVRVRNVWFVTCFRCWSRLDALVSFSRVSSTCCFQSFVTVSTWFPRVALGNSAGSRCVTSSGKLSSPLQSLSSLFCGVTALARSWTSLVGFVVRVQRTGFQVSLARVGARSYEFRSTRELRERARALARRFKLSGVDIAHRRLVQSERRYGAEPRLHDILARHFHVTKNNFYPCIKTLIRFTHL